MPDRSPQLGGQPTDRSPSLSREWTIIRRPIWILNDDYWMCELLFFIFHYAHGVKTLHFLKGTGPFQAHLAELTPAETPSLILLDDVMPEMDGFEVLHNLIRPHPLLSDTPVVLVSARRPGKIFMEVFRARIKDVIYLPLHLEILETLLDKYQIPHKKGRDDDHYHHVS